MKTLILAAGLSLIAATAFAEIDFAFQAVDFDDAGGGRSDMTVWIDMRTHGPLSASTTDVSLHLDGILHDQVWIDYSIYEAPGCTYDPDYYGGPACVDDPGCTAWTIGGMSVPGDCVLLIPGGVPLSCWCSHIWNLKFFDLELEGVNVIELVLDTANDVQEHWEDNNVLTIEDPVAAESSRWGTIKGLYR